MAKAFFGANGDYTEAKILTEGRGYICETKHKNAQKKWEDLPVIITTNSLPYIVGNEAQQNIDQRIRYEYKAF